jgi:hypothetical protein
MRLMIVDLGLALIAGQCPSIILKAAVLCRLVKQMRHCLIISNKARDAKITGGLSFRLNCGLLMADNKYDKPDLRNDCPAGSS